MTSNRRSSHLSGLLRGFAAVAALYFFVAALVNTFKIAERPGAEDYVFLIVLGYWCLVVVLLFAMMIVMGLAKVTKPSSIAVGLLFWLAACWYAYTLILQ